jgi:hypothetical protein
MVTRQYSFRLRLHVLNRRKSTMRVYDFQHMLHCDPITPGVQHEYLDIKRFKFAASVEYRNRPNTTITQSLATEVLSG